MKEILQMSIKEADRLGVMRRIDNKILTVRKASEELGVSLRQTKRIRKNYLLTGEAGLVSQKRGKASHRKIPEETRKRVMTLLTTTYQGFGPTFASEKLKERDFIQLSSETLRTWMIEEKIHKPKKRKIQKVYQRRPRRSRFGELLQGDGSPHAWFGEDKEKCTLVQFVDDATGVTTAARFMPQETTEGYLAILQDHLEKYGRPLALYVDKHSIFRVNHEEIKKGMGITHVGTVLKGLEIQLICAHSPQAKGRIERRNGVCQDRLIKEMKLRGIDTMEKGNEFLPVFFSEFNPRFGVEAANPEDAHRPLRSQDNLKRLFSRKDKRTLSKDLTFQHKGTLYMLTTKTPNRLRGAAIEVIWRNGEEVEVERNGEKLAYKKWSETVYEQPQICTSKEIATMNLMSEKVKKPSKHHPWR